MKNDFYFAIQKAEKITTKYICDDEPFRQTCLNCGKKLKPSEQFIGFCKECQNKFRE